MKLQLQGQSVRLRVDEAELARLLARDSVVNRVVLGAGAAFSQWLLLGAGATASLVVRDGGWHIGLPHDAVEVYAGQLPCRHALVFELEAGPDEMIELNFEVDVRDSLKTRGPRRRPQAAG